jgi:hypothetical protein
MIEFNRKNARTWSLLGPSGAHGAAALELAETNPKIYDYCIHGGAEVDGIWQPDKNGLGLGKVLDYIGVNYEKEADSE